MTAPIENAEWPGDGREPCGCNGLPHWLTDACPTDGLVLLGLGAPHDPRYAADDVAELLDRAALDEGQDDDA